MTTIATGGFSTFNNSILGFQSDIVSWTIIVFMFLGAINFSLHFLLIAKKSFEYFNDSEFRFYVSFILFFFILTFINVASIYGYTFKNITLYLFKMTSKNYKKTMEYKSATSGFLTFFDCFNL